MASGWIAVGRTARVLAALLFAAFNLLPLYGIRAWGWDAFQVLILFWSETVVLAGWSMARLALIPPALLGEMLVNGRPVKATRRMMLGFFSLHAGAFIGAHLLFLCLLFSGDWFSRLNGVGDFLRTFYVSSGAWAPLALAAIAGGIETLTGEFRPAFLAPAAREPEIVPSAQPGRAGDAVGRVVGALYGRIVIMQVAIIGGAWAAQSWGSMAPLMIVIGLKTLVDLGRAFAAGGPWLDEWRVSAGGVSYERKNEPDPPRPA